MASILRPGAVRSGDAVAIAAKSNGRDPDEVALFEQGVATIESLGFRVQVSPLAGPATPTGGPLPRRTRPRRS